MGAITAYSITVAIVLAMEFIVYRSLLANATFYRFNRAVLLACYALALVALPLSRLSAGHADVQGGAEVAGAIAVQLQSGADAEPSDVLRAIPIVYLLGVVAVALMTAVSYAKMWQIVRRGEKRRLKGATLVVTQTAVAPFSWGRYVIVSAEDAANSLIVEHELTHIRQRHTVDLIVAQMFIIFNWFNPAAYLMRRELSAVHEYEVDMQILKSGVNAADYQMLLIKKTVGPGFQSIANSLNHSQLNNRLTMMLKSRTKAARRLCAAALLPAVALAVAMTDFPAVASTIGDIASVRYDKVSESSSTLQAGTAAAQTETVDAADVMPEYPGGIVAAMQAVMAEIKWPASEPVKEDYDGLTIVGFTVMADGSVADVQCVKSCGIADFDAEALGAVKKAFAGSKWTPGTVDGKVVNCRFAIPIRFKTK